MTDRIVAFTVCLLTAGVLGLAQPTSPGDPAAPVIADEREALDALQPPPPPPPPAPRQQAPARPRPTQARNAPEQQPPPPPPPPAPLAGTPREAQRQGQPINVKVDVTITDQRGGTAALKKTVTVVTGDGLGGLIRSSGTYHGQGEVPLNVDAEPLILTDGKVRLKLTLQYDLPGTTVGPAQPDASRDATPVRTSLHEALALILESGKPMIATQSADPMSDRQVTVEVKATILR